MPELPEVEVVRRGLAARVVGRTIGEIQVRHPRSVRHQDGGGQAMGRLLIGRVLDTALRRGKFLWLTTDDPDLVLAAHLGMSGQFRFDAGTFVSSHARVRFSLDDEDLWFVDQRTFGWVAAEALVTDSFGQRVPTCVARIALDVADQRFDPATTATSMGRSSRAIKSVLLDQAVVSGIGNIYADEALFRARVHPQTPARQLSGSALVGVLASAAQVMDEALAAGGTSFDSLYVNVNGESGYFSRGLAVYGRAGLACVRCARPIQMMRLGNRSAHYCSNCQRRLPGSQSGGGASGG